MSSYRRKIGTIKHVLMLTLFITIIGFLAFIANHDYYSDTEPASIQIAPAGETPSAITEAANETAAPQAIDPRIVGYDSSSLPFRINGDAVYEDQGDHKRLTNLDAEFKLQSGDSLFVKANEALYNQEKQQLQLNGDVNLNSNGGANLSAPLMTMNYEQKSAAGSGGVKLEDQKGEIQAQEFKAEQNYNKITFQGGRVKGVIYQDE